MPDETITPSQPVIEKPAPEVMHLIAKNPRQMAKSQKSLQEWLSNKVAFEKREQEEMQASVAIALDKGWEMPALERQLTRAVGRVRYYEKLLAAVDEGYCIVPNFPIDFFAIRTGHKKPRYQYHEIRDASPSHDPSVRIDRIPPEALAMGEGQYVSDTPLVEGSENTVQDEKRGKSILVKDAWTTDFAEVAFPLIAARPEIMDATAIAMAHKLFDAIGILPPQKQPDPLIIGKIFGAGRRWHRAEASFMIAWHLDLRTL